MAPYCTILYHETIRFNPIHSFLLPHLPSGSLVRRWVCMPLRLTALICSVQRVRKSAAMSLALQDLRPVHLPHIRAWFWTICKGFVHWTIREWMWPRVVESLCCFHKKRSRRFQESLIVRAHYSRQGASSASLSSFASLTSRSQPKSITENRSLKVYRFRLCISQTRRYCFSRPLHNRTRLRRTSTKQKNSNVVSVDLVIAWQNVTNITPRIFFFWQMLQNTPRIRLWSIALAISLFDLQAFLHFLQSRPRRQNIYANAKRVPFVWEKNDIMVCYGNQL